MDALVVVGGVQPVVALRKGDTEANDVGITVS